MSCTLNNDTGIFKVYNATTNEFFGYFPSKLAYDFLTTTYRENAATITLPSSDPDVLLNPFCANVSIHTDISEVDVPVILSGANNRDTYNQKDPTQAILINLNLAYVGEGPDGADACQTAGSTAQIFTNGSFYPQLTRFLTLDPCTLEIFPNWVNPDKTQLLNLTWATLNQTDGTYPDQYNVLFTSNLGSASLDGTPVFNGVDKNDVFLPLRIFFEPFSSTGSPSSSAPISPSPSTTGSTSPSTTPNHHSHIGAIVGGAVGGAILLFLVIAKCCLSSCLGSSRARKHSKHSRRTRMNLDEDCTVVAHSSRDKEKSVERDHIEDIRSASDPNWGLGERTGDLSSEIKQAASTTGIRHGAIFKGGIPESSVPSPNDRSKAETKNMNREAESSNNASVAIPAKAPSAPISDPVSEDPSQHSPPSSFPRNNHPVSISSAPQSSSTPASSSQHTGTATSTVTPTIRYVQHEDARRLDPRRGAEPEIVVDVPPAYEMRDD